MPKPIIRNAEATFGSGVLPVFRVNVELSDLSIASRERLFSALLRDEDIVTAKPGTPAHDALIAAVEAACKWEGA